MYKFVDCHYDRESLIELFSVSNKARIKSLYQVTDDLIGKDCIDSVFAQFPNIAHNRYNVELGRLSTYVKPYISPGNNGLVIIPLEGSLTMNFYSYPGTRETLHPSRKMSVSELNDIKSILLESVIVDRPFIFNGLVPHDYQPTGAPVLTLILKIPLNINWESI
jgi:hypothetical protein